MDMCQKVPPRVINLNKWSKEFVCFIQSESQKNKHYSVNQPNEETGLTVLLLLQDCFNKTLEVHSLKMDVNF